MPRSDPTQAFWRDPALPFVESRRACRSRACYKPHSHPTYSIGAVDDGTSAFTGVAAQEKEAALIEFIGDCDSGQVSCIETPSIPSQLSEQIRPALDFLHATPAVNVTLDRLARLAGMSRYRVIRAFRAVTGMTPHAWQLNRRINLARERIREGDDISDVAHHLGFADQAHFQRVFKAHVGTTPGRFRA
ncbi:MAG: helix-turn-helix transcriptional regulator [Gemmatimonadales bacterium]|nr:helix-turn-helix transcriptional regulator [Gemmatimonadales bacterium]